MRRTGFSWLAHGLLATVLLTTIWVASATADEAERAKSETVDYIRDIRPILSDACYVCHGPDEGSREAELRLDIQESALGKSALGKSALGKSASGEISIVPGKPTESELLRRISTDDEDERMPPAETGKSLKPEQVELIRRWIEQGAEWQEHWSFVPPKRPESPAVSDNNWPRNSIDSFILARLDADLLKPSVEADREILLRRVSFDLTGLPPTLKEIDAFLADGSPESYERVIDRLLESPHYGEHMARFWLDAARYGDTHGLHLDNYREIWPYRDWVVRAFNNNMPYDQFTIEQLAGDLLPNATFDQRVATGFCRCNVSTSEGGSIEEEVYTRNVIDRVTTMGTVFLGLTLECARCHDHKFDPLTMHDFYSLFAFFNSIDGPALDGNVADTQPSELAPTPEQASQLEQSSKRIAELQSLQKKHREEMESAFQRWVQQQEKSSGESVQPVTAPIVAGLVGHYTLDIDPEGKVTNSVTPENPGQAEGKPQSVKPLSVPGRYGTGVELSEEAYLDLGDLFDLEHDKSFSIGVWVRLPKDSKGTILSKTKGGSQRGYALTVNKGQFSFFLTHKRGSDVIQVASPKNVLIPNRWTHLLVTYNGSARAAGVEIYVNGNRQPSVVKKDSLLHQGAPRTVDSGDAHFVIGRFGTGQPLVGGQVDDLQIFDRRISMADVIHVMFREGVGDRLEQAIGQPKPESLTAEQLEELRQYYFHHSDGAYAELFSEQAQLDTLRSEILPHVANSLVWRERKEPRDAFVLTRGEYDQKGEKVERATPAIFSPMPDDAPRDRLGLAQWLVDPKNPLTARVAVNRFWAQVFGTGLVKTGEDFGSQGDVPSHPALFDSLTVDFVENEWNVKALMKTLVMSNTYRQSSRMTPEIIERDPENRLFARGPRFRLDAEMLRDQALAVSGVLVKTLGGPSVKPPQPAGLWSAVGYAGSNTVRFVADTDHEQIHRRTLYTFLKRTSPPPQMSTFDAPSREGCVVRRERTNTPLQALLMLNDPQYVEAARALAQRTMREAGSNSESRIRRMLRLCTGRKPSQAAVDELHKLYRDQLEQFEQDPDRAKLLVSVGQLPQDDQLDVTQLAAWTMVANVILNLDEVVTKN